MIKRLRDRYADEDLSSVYTHQYDHTRWTDHVQRIEYTREFAKIIIAERGCTSVADLSCGDGAIALHLGLDNVILGDFVEGYQFHGKIEDTILEIPDVDLFILSETLEHIDDPTALLKAIRRKASCVIVTTPFGEVDDGNPEHYWGWDEDGVHDLLKASRWTPHRYELFTPDVPQVYYTYQVWAAI